MDKKTLWDKYKDVIIFITVTILLLSVTDIRDVIDYYADSDSYVEYVAEILDFGETSGRYRNYYCLVEYYDDKVKVVEDCVYREYGDSLGDQIKIYVTDEGRIYRKGYVKYMNHMRISMIYLIYLICTVIGSIKRKIQNRK
ncbi:MAG: hypothetical protein E7264_06665 [Lachnospiraceae bacterium]|nr:hypothetical protein [Lachnospiraceae bacterium]